MPFNGVRKNQLKALQHMSTHSGNRPGHTGAGAAQPMTQGQGYAPLGTRGPFGPGVDPANRPLPNTLAQAPSPPSSPGLVGAPPKLMRDISQQRSTGSGGPAPPAPPAPFSGGPLDVGQYPASAMDALSDQIATGAHWDQANKAKAWNDNRRAAVTGALQGAQQALAQGGNASLYQGGGIPVGAAAPKASDALAGYDQALKARAERRANRARESAIRASQNAEASVADNADRLRELGYLGEGEAATLDNVAPNISAPGVGPRGNEDTQRYRDRLKARREEALALRRSSLPYRQQTRGNDLNVQTLGGPMGTVQNNVQARFGGPRMSLAQGIEAAQRYAEGPDNQAMRRLAWTDPEAYGRIQSQREQIASQAATAKMAADAQRDIASGRDKAMIKTTELQNQSRESIAKGQNKVARKEGKRRSSDLEAQLKSDAEDRKAQERVAVAGGMAAAGDMSAYGKLAQDLGMATSGQIPLHETTPQTVKQGLDQAIKVAPEIEQTYGDVASWTEVDFAAEVRDRLNSSAPPTAQDLQPLLAYVQGMRRSTPGFASAPGLVAEGLERDFFDDLINGMDPMEALKQWDKRQGNVNKRDNAAIFGSYLDYGGM